ncbi:MAG: NFACT RNA binding domain-containing protein [Gemmatimonadota bacterium]|nr:NFACT RNA binding domain-containing protein [Gemmatimonadota bacterium]
MIWDPCLARAVAAELENRLAGARARAIRFNREARRVTVHFRDATLVVDLSPGTGVIVLREAAEPGPDAEALPAALTGVEAVWDERVIVFGFRRVRGRKPHPSLIVELATNRWNALWVDGPELHVRKRLTGPGSRKHRIGQPWASPTAQADSRRTDELDVAAWERRFEGLDAEDARRTLLTGVAYTSSLNAAYLLDAPTWEEGFHRWRAMYAQAAPSPHLLEMRSGLQPYPWPMPGTPARPTHSLLEGMGEVLAAAHPDAGHAQVAVARSLARERRRIQRKLKRLRRELERTTRADRMRDEAALILSSLHLIDIGSSEAELIGFDGKPHMVSLDPASKPQEHANALFRRAGRLERGAVTLRDRIREAEAERARLEDLQQRARNGELTPREIAALIPATAKRSPARPGSAPLPYRSYRSSGGLEIRVGRGARHNDDLTFHHSRPADIWLHARHAAGAHVILRWTSPERPPAVDLEQAAILAANHSGARAAATVPVDWTRRKWVRKPRGAVPGAVIPDRVRTVFVSPDSALAERLRPWPVRR